MPCGFRALLLRLQFGEFDLRLLAEEPVGDVCGDERGAKGVYLGVPAWPRVVRWGGEGLVGEDHWGFSHRRERDCDMEHVRVDEEGVSG